MAYSDRVLKAFVSSTRKNKVRYAHLVQIPQPLELWSVDNSNVNVGHFNVTVDGIVEDLH